MLRFISWPNFLFATVIFLLFYWFVVSIAYYKREIRGFFNKGKHPIVGNFEAPNKNEEYLFDRCNDCASILKSVIRKSSLEQPDKVRLISEIRASIYPFLEFKGSVWQTPINNLIKYESLQACAVGLNESDIEAIWNLDGTINDLKANQKI